MALSDKARQAKNEYQRRYRANNRERHNAKQREYHKKWRDANKDKLREYYERYWQNKATEMESCLDRAIAYEADKTDNEVTGTIVTGQAGQSICINCGGFFVPKRSTAKYCGELCRKQYNRAKAKRDNYRDK